MRGLRKRTLRNETLKYDIFLTFAPEPQFSELFLTFFRNFERPFTPRTKLRSARNFGKTRFGRFATFDFLTPIFFCSELFFEFFSTVFHYFRYILEELGIFGRQNRIPRSIFALDCQIFTSVQRLEPISWLCTVRT